jgi:AcrR family transcriptional regulator
MEPSVKRERSRQYNASRRQEAAAETRRAIVSAARQLFLERGYVGTTMPAIAKAAGVSLDTVYASAGAKPVLFRHLIETAISGAEDPIPALQRNYVREIQAEPDPVRKIAIYAHAVRLIQPRLAPLFAVLRDAAQSDDDLRQLWADISQRRAANMRLFAAELAASSGLRADLTIEQAADIIWSMNASEFYLLLVDQRGWSLDQFESFLSDAWTRILLPDRKSPPLPKRERG